MLRAPLNIHPKLFYKIGATHNFVKFTGNQLYRSLFIKLAGLWPATSLKNFLKFCEIFKNIFFYRTPPVAAADFMKFE